MQTHSFHIPVMGTGFTIDTPIKVARYGISSVISLVDDHLIEEMRRYYCGIHGEDFTPIPEKDMDHRALRITEYLNLVGRIVRDQVAAMKDMPFDGASDLSVYFELMDDASPAKQAYRRMMLTTVAPERSAQEAFLRELVTPGRIDVNIMTKADRENTFEGQKLSREYSDAMAALRGFAKSSLESAVVFSAGLNPYLYSYAAQFDDFFPTGDGASKKTVVLKVSDFRSASIQAKTLAKKGVWVSEYRIESGLNCGGHAFATTGLLLGPILEEFKTKKADLTASLFPFYQEALLKMGRPVPTGFRPVRFTAQGGVGTAEEHRFLLKNYGLDSVGWGTPFLLVPEVTAVDEGTLNALVSEDKDVYLSRSSPLGVPYYTLRNSASNAMRLERIRSGRPGSPCVNKNLALNTEYGEPLCVASTRYQRLKLDDLQRQALTGAELAVQTEAVLEKACICRDLGDGAMVKYGIRDLKKQLTPAVCPGPNIMFFSKICTLKEMVGHIYGRNSVLDPERKRPHVFLNELKIYIDYYKDLVVKSGRGASPKDTDYLAEFKQNLIAGIDHYRVLAKVIHETSASDRDKFAVELRLLSERLQSLALPTARCDSGFARV